MSEKRYNSHFMEPSLTDVVCHCEYNESIITRVGIEIIRINYMN